MSCLVVFIFLLLDIIVKFVCKLFDLYTENLLRCIAIQTMELPSYQSWEQVENYEQLVKERVEKIELTKLKAK